MFNYSILSRVQLPTGLLNNKKLTFKQKDSIIYVESWKMIKRKGDIDNDRLKR